MYRRGPSTEPCGSPYGAGTHGVLVDPWTTEKERSWRKEPSQSRRFPERPKEAEMRMRRIPWSTVSKAALTSNRAKRVVTCDLSIAPYMAKSRLFASGILLQAAWFVV